MKNLVNNNPAPERFEYVYDHSYRYDYILKTTIHYVNQLINTSKLYFIGYENTWETAPLYEAGYGATFCVLVKSSINKGVHTVIICDSHWVSPCA